MSESSKKVIQLKPESAPARMLVTLSVGELREMIRQELQAIERTGAEADEWVDIKMAAKLMGVSPEWLYHNRKTLPFVSKIGPRLLRFSRNGLQKWMASRKA
jgi:predicted DNA-binding transcriptional regulator AlpA